MPCNQVRTVSLDLGQIQVRAMVAALYQLGHKKVTVSADETCIESDGIKITGGKITARAYKLSQVYINKIKQAYSKQIVLQAANKFGWKVQDQTKPMETRIYMQARKGM